MANLPEPCPMCDTGTIDVSVNVETDLVSEIHHGVEYVTHVTITCELIAACDTCDFNEIVTHDRQHTTFDQVFHLNEQPPEPDPQFLQSIEEMSQLLYEEGSYVE